jgi:enoyl-CoA hydratase/carnithine racemase
MSEATVLKNRVGFVLTLTLNRPAQMNAFNREQWCALRDALAAAREDPEIRCVVVTGTGDAFTAGQDLGEMATPPPVDGEHAGVPFSSFMDELIRFDKPLFAAVNGVGVGIGLTLLLHCDFVMIANSARLRAPFVRLGVVPEAASSYLLEAVVGIRNAAEILFTAGWVSGARAVEIGLANSLHPVEKVLAAAEEKAREVARHGPASLRHTKRLLLATRAEAVAAARAREDEAFVVRTGSPENLEAIRAFFEKREPDFEGLSQD